MVVSHGAHLAAAFERSCVGQRHEETCAQDWRGRATGSSPGHRVADPPDALPFDHLSKETASTGLG